MRNEPWSSFDGGIARGAPAEAVEGDEAVLPDGAVAEGLGIKAGGEFAVFSKAEVDALKDGGFVVAGDVGEVLAVFDVVPAGVAVVVLVIFPPVSFKAGIESGVCGDGFGDVSGASHVVVGLALVEVVEAEFVDFLGGEFVALATAFGVGVGVKLWLSGAAEFLGGKWEDEGESEKDFHRNWGEL